MVVYYIITLFAIVRVNIQRRWYSERSKRKRKGRRKTVGDARDYDDDILMMIMIMLTSD